MFFKLTILILALLTWTLECCCASIPEDTIITSAVNANMTHPIEINTQITYTKSPGVDGLPSELAALIKTSSPNTGFHTLSPRADPDLILCNQVNCTGICGTVDLNLAPVSVCFASSLIFISGSVEVSGTTVPASPKIFVAQPDCTDSFQLTVANTCQNFLINGTPGFFDTFVLVT